MTGNRRSTVEIAAELFRELGYDACRELREDLRLQMLEHRQQIKELQIKELRIESGLVRSRGSRNPTSSQKAVKFVTSVTRDLFVKRKAPDLLQLVTAGKISLWAAYQQLDWLLRRETGPVNSALSNVKSSDTTRENYDLAGESSTSSGQ